MRKRAWQGVGGSLVVALFLFIYAIWGDAVIPASFLTHFKEANAAAAVEATLDHAIVFHYGEPIMVAQAVDGDTALLINGEHVRYNGIDTPEKNDPRKPVQCYSEEATVRNRELVEGQMITVYKDVSEKDKYGRWVGFVYLQDGTFVNPILVEEGYAFAYRYAPDTSKAAEFKTAENRAKSAGLGLWSACTVTRNSSGRGQTNAVSP